MCNSHNSFGHSWSTLRSTCTCLSLRVYVFLLAPSIKFTLNLKIDSCCLKNILLDPVYCKEHCGLYLLFQGRIFGKIFKIYCWNITESFFLHFEKSHSIEKDAWKYLELQYTKPIILFISYFVKL